MDNKGRGGGGGGSGGRTPRGRKPRGNRGRGQDSPRTPTSSAASPNPNPTEQSPSSATTTVSSTTSPGLSTPPSRGGVGRDELSKVESPKSIQSTPKEVTSSTGSTSLQSPSPSKMSSSDQTKVETVPTKDEGKSDELPSTPKTEERETIVSTPSSEKGKEEDDEEEDDGKEDNARIKADQVVTPVSTASSAEYKTPMRDLEPPEIPSANLDDTNSSGSTTTESKVAEALSQKPLTTAKTLVVNPQEVERSTDNPTVVDIDPQVFSSPIGSAPDTRPSSSQSQTRQRGSGATSPAYAYALRGPVGKPGYIGGVGFSDDDEAPSRKNSALARRESAIAAVETAVRGFTKRQWVLLFMFGLIDLLASVTISLQAPFYPAEAERKGATATEYGLVFGIFEFCIFLTSPFFGKYMNKLGPKTVFSVCILISSIAVICFGLLDRIDDHTTFITLCFVCRIFEALGCAGFFTATFVIIAIEFPQSVATTFASLETFFGLGMIIGPSLGGALFGIGGFSLPFFVVGGALLFTAILSLFVMPKIDKARDEDGTEQVGYGVWTILKFPSVLLASLSIATTSVSLGFISAILEPHIRQFGLTPLQTGLVFIVNGGVYALTAPIWGYICDYIQRPIYITILGNFLVFVSFLLVGPIAFMPFETILWVTIVGLIIQGLGFGCCLVSGFIIGLRDSMKHGLPDNMATYGVASGLWTSCISLGAFVGPSAAGVLYQNYGFREASYLVLIGALVAGAANLTYLCFTTGEITPGGSDSESQPLLRPISPLLKKKEVEEKTPPQQSTSAYGSTSGTPDV